MSPSNRPVLIVEDDPDIIEAIRDVLSLDGYEVAQAGDGRAALAYLRSNPAPPLILLDWNMAPMNGPEFMAEVAKEGAFAKIPVVLLTADVNVDEKSKTFSFVGYLKKPFILDALLEMVGRYCQ